MQTLKNSKKLRQKQTSEENRLWLRLKNRRLGDYKFRRQVVLDGFIVDFCCFDKRLVVELDGFHHRASRQEDTVRDNYLKSQGFQILRIWNSEITSDLEKVLNKLLALLETPSSGPGKPRPPSPVKGEGNIVY